MSELLFIVYINEIIEELLIKRFREKDLYLYKRKTAQRQLK